MDPDRDPNRIRWGDIYPINLAAAVLNLRSQQIVNARSRDLPETWTVFLYANNGSIPAVGVVNYNFNVTLGVGAGTVTFHYIFEFTGAGGPVETPVGMVSGTVTELYKSLEIPAKDIQIACVIDALGTGVATQGTFGAWVAPRVPPPETTHERHGGWMPSGFHPEQLHYK